MYTNGGFSKIIPHNDRFSFGFIISYVGGMCICLVRHDMVPSIRYVTTGKTAESQDGVISYMSIFQVQLSSSNYGSGLPAL